MAHATRLAQALRLDLAAQWTPTKGELSQPRDQGADPAGPCAKPKARHWRSSSTISRKATAIDLIAEAPRILAEKARKDDVR